MGWIKDYFASQRYGTVVARHIHLQDHQPRPTRVEIPAIRERYKNAADFVVIEDHQGFLAKDQVRVPDGLGPGVIAGREYVGKAHTKGFKEHHFGLMGIDAKEGPAVRVGKRHAALSRELQARVHQQDGVLVFNHPEWYKMTDLAYRLPADEAAAVDAVEVFNDNAVVHNNPANVLRWVDRNFYQRGLFPAVASGTDEHSDTTVAKTPSFTVTLARSKEKSEANVMSSMRAGATYVTQDLGVRFYGALDLHYALGDRPLFGKGTSHTLDLDLHGLRPGSRVEIVENGNVVADETVEGDHFVRRHAFSAKPGGDGKHGYLYVIVHDADGATYFATSAFAYETA